MNPYIVNKSRVYGQYKKMFEIEQWPILRNYLKEQQAGASGSSGLSAGGSGSSGRPTIPSRSFGLPSEASSRSGLPAEASRSSELPEISVEQLSSSEKKADSSSDDEIRKYTSKTKVQKTYQIILNGFLSNT